MGSELGNSQGNSPKRITFKEAFDNLFPYYLSYGMTYEQFYEGDPELARAYRKAHEIRNQEINQQEWVQGYYIYEALLDVAPILHAFARRGTKPEKYLEEPIPLTDKEAKDRAEEKRVRNLERLRETLIRKSKEHKEE